MRISEERAAPSDALPSTPLDPDHARRQRCYNRIELAARHLRLLQPGRCSLIHAMQRKDVLGEIDSDGNNSRDFPFRVS